MINCLIVDDEPLAQDILERYINGNDKLCLIKKCSTALEAFETLHQQKIDLLFLDVKMPALNGIDFLKSLKNPPAVIFTTAFSEYAVASYDLNAVDYLLKPITQERFNKGLEKLFKPQLIVVEEQKDYTYFKVSSKLIRVRHEDILFAQSIKDYILLFTINGNLIIHMTMKYLVELLPHNKFARVHRSYVVNLKKVEVVTKNQLNIGSVEIPIGESYSTAINLL